MKTVITPILKKEIRARLAAHENQHKIAFSRRYPLIQKPTIFCRRMTRKLTNLVNLPLKYERQTAYLPYRVASHQSVLRRRLGNSDPYLQEQKIINLRQAIQKLNGVMNKPGTIFSLWKILGQPKYRKGYVDGMLLTEGKVIAGLGGGLCQLSNFLYWIFLHAPVAIVERHHHSMDIFPDAGRVIPFGGGATIFYNYLDLRVKNLAVKPLQIKIWLTEKHLKGAILSSAPIPQKYHISEKNHFFIQRGKRFFRYNEIYRETRINGEVVKVEKIITNFAPVLYAVTPEYLQKNQFRLLTF